MTTRLVLIVAVIAVLAACGVDGPPVRPAAPKTAGVTLSGDATMGVVTRL